MNVLIFCTDSTLQEYNMLNDEVICTCIMCVTNKRFKVVRLNFVDQENWDNVLLNFQTNVY